MGSSLRHVTLAPSPICGGMVSPQRLSCWDQARPGLAVVEDSLACPSLWEDFPCNVPENLLVHSPDG